MMWDHLQGGVWINLATSLLFSLFWFCRATTKPDISLHQFDQQTCERAAFCPLSQNWMDIGWRQPPFFLWFVFPTPAKQTLIWICRRSNGFCNMLLPLAIKTEGKTCTWGSDANNFLNLPPSISVNSLCLQQRTILFCKLVRGGKNHSLAHY